MSGTGDSSSDRHRDDGPNQVSRSVYGLVTVLGVLQVFQEHTPRSWRAVVVLFGTTFAVALLEVYSELLDVMIQRRRSLTREETRRIAAEEAPVLAGAQGPTIILLLAALGILSTERAVDIAQVVALVSLFGFGFRAARGVHRHWLRQIVSGLALVAIGLVIVALKVAVH
jgi:hypothetical protein